MSVNIQTETNHMFKKIFKLIEKEIKGSEQEHFLIVSEALSRVVTLFCHSVISDEHFDQKLNYIDDFCMVCKTMLKEKCAN